MDKLKKYPFEMQRQDQALLLARYVVEDTGEGLFLQDMDTSQSGCIIRSILGKVIGEIKTYDREEAEALRLQVGKIMSRFGKLVQQFFEMKEGSNREQLFKPTGKGERVMIVTKEQMEEALENSLTSLQN